MKNYLKYLLSLLLFGSNGIIASQIANSGLEIVFMRTGIGVHVPATILLLGRHKFTAHKNRRSFCGIILSGIAMGLSWIMLFTAYSHIGVSLSSLLYYCGPVIVMLLSPALFGEKLTLQRICGFVLVLAGILCVNGAAGSGSLDFTGILCSAGSAVFYAAMVIFNKKSDVTGLENSAIQIFVGFITAGVVLAVGGGLPFHVEVSDIGWILLLGLVNTGIGCGLYFSTIGKLNVQTVAVCGYLEPVCAVILSILILKEQLFPVQMLGAALIIGGAMVCEGVFFGAFT